MDRERSLDKVAVIAQAIANSDNRASLSSALDDLAALAKTDSEALELLLATIVDRRLAEVSVRKVFFDENAIDDSVQETVLAVIAGISSFRGEAAFLTWLDRVALNVARQVRRRGQRQPKPTQDNLPDETAWARRISSVVATEVLVAQAFAQLNEEHREIIQLREMKGLSYDQIAQQVDLPIGTVRSRLSRARHELAQLLASLQKQQLESGR